MTDESKLSKVEHLKEGSRQLRGTLAEELLNDLPNISKDSAQLIKHHGSYQQDNRDARKEIRTGPNSKAKSVIFMVRTRVPGGKVSADQFLAELDLCERFGNGTLRITSRQGLQLHGVLKQDLKSTIRAINETKLTTLAACGDVERNVMCCPAPYKQNAVRAEMQRMTDAIAEHLKPRTTAYYEIWLKDENGEEKVSEFKPVDEPIYGPRYLPRKFKTGVALPEDNCIDIYANDLGFLAIVENGKIVGYNVLVGGGMGTVPSADKCFPAVAKRMAFCTPEQVLGVAEAVVKVQRDFGNRADRKIARMKYLIADWGMERFKATVDEYYGKKLPECHPADVTDVDDHLGWHEQGDGRWFVGINVDSGRIKDEGDERIKTGLRTLVEKYRMPTRLTALQSILLCDIEERDRRDIDKLLVDHGIKLADQLPLLRRYAMACPAMPTCGLAITESERVLPELLAQFEAETARQGLANERITIHMTGCPNGCARPYTPDIGLVGRGGAVGDASGKYTIFLGGNATGTRLGFVFKDHVPFEEVVPVLAPVFEQFKSERTSGESFGDFCLRKGSEGLPGSEAQLVTANSVANGTV